MCSFLIPTAGSALSQARQWPVQLSPVPGGIIDPQTVQTTTSAWNQATGSNSRGLEEIFTSRLVGIQQKKKNAWKQAPAFLQHVPEVIFPPNTCKTG